MGIMQKVLVPVDLHEEGSLMCDFVCGMRAVGTTDAVIANAVDPSGLEQPFIAGKIDKATAALQRMTNCIGDCGIRLEYRVTLGSPGEEIAHLSSAERFTGMVIGTHGRSDWAKLFAGSVSSELVSRVKIPMMLVRFDLLRNADDPKILSQKFTQTLVVPVDFSVGSTRAVLSLIDMKLPRTGQVFLVHVVKENLDEDTQHAVEVGVEFEMKNLQSMLKAGGIDSRIVIRHGDADRVLLDEVSRRRATGIVMGARGRTAMEAAILGSKSSALVNQASCPVLIVP